MVLTKEQQDKLRELAFAGVANKEISHQMGLPMTEVYAQRSRMGITRDKVALAKGGQPRNALVAPKLVKAVQKVNYPQIGETLANGYMVDANYRNLYVLAHSDKAPQSYAVWSVDQDGGTINGRYFADCVKAQKCFVYFCFDWLEEPVL